MGKLELKDQKFGMLTVIKESEKRFAKCRSILWECKCECGNTAIVSGTNLKTGNTKSCGCITKERITNLNYNHGLSRKRVYRILISMKTRCYNKKVNEYKEYGGRGIIVCADWLNDFMNFYNWSMKNGYSDTLSIDRIDNDGNYEPNNCRWATMKEQSNNNRHNRFITYNDETKTMKEWCEKLNLGYNTIRLRIYNGWSTERAFETPIIKR